MIRVSAEELHANWDQGIHPVIIDVRPAYAQREG